MTQNLAVWLVSGEKFGSGEHTHVAVTQTSRRCLMHLNLCSLTDHPLFLRVTFTSLLSDALCFAILDTSWRWNYVELIFCAWLTLLGIRTSIALQYVTGFPSTLKLSNIALYVHTILSLLVLVSIGVISTSWLWWIILNMCIQHLCFRSLAVYPGVGLLIHMVFIFLIF